MTLQTRINRMVASLKPDRLSPRDRLADLGGNLLLAFVAFSITLVCLSECGLIR